MNSTLSIHETPNIFSSPVSGVKVELSRYRLAKPTQSNASTTKQTLNSANPPQFISRKSKPTSIDLKNVGQRSRNPSFTIFLEKEANKGLSIPKCHQNRPISMEIRHQDKKIASQKQTTFFKEKKTGVIIKNSKQQKSQPKEIQCYSFLDLSDREDKGEESLGFPGINKLRDPFVNEYELTEQVKEGVNDRYQVIASEVTSLGDDEETQMQESIKKLEDEKENESVKGPKLNENSIEQGQERAEKLNKACLRLLNVENKILSKKVKELEEKSVKRESLFQIMVRSYRGLKKEWKEYKAQNELDKKTIATLKEQVTNLKAFCKIQQSKEIKVIKKAAQDTQDKNSLRLIVQELEDKLKIVQTENKKLKSDVHFLKEENKKLKSGQEEVEKHKTHYKTIAEDKLKECSALAEEIICLRTDLDRLHLKYLKTAKELQHSKSCENSEILPSKSPETVLSGAEKLIQSCPSKNLSGVPNLRSKNLMVSTPSPFQYESSLDQLEIEDMKTPTPAIFHIEPSEGGLEEL